ncbi:hypothetical protein M5K25_023385 [Dendrobium thyrsiflorum]|uniref:Uncharacterized protein n=1 Tax=Dendrobium thyrsiflorum TaxID=117978 RepID=A0ABD0U816_DENTH
MHNVGKSASPNQRANKEIPNNNIGGRSPIFDSILIPTALNCYSIITNAYVAILYYDILTRICNEIHTRKKLSLGCTFSCAPPLFSNLEIAATARLNASVFIVTPSPTPPKSVRLNATGRSLGKAVPGGRQATHRKIRIPSTELLCHKNKEEKTIIQSKVNRKLCNMCNIALCDLCKRVACGRASSLEQNVEPSGGGPAERWGFRWGSDRTGPSGGGPTERRASRWWSGGTSGLEVVVRRNVGPSGGGPAESRAFRWCMVRRNVGPSGGGPAVVRQNSGGSREGAREQERSLISLLIPSSLDPFS